jgi:hypothetical protein
MNVLDPILDNIPVLGPLWKGIEECVSLRNFIAALVPCLALGVGAGGEGLSGLLYSIIVFYIFTIIGAMIIQYWDCKSEKSFVDKFKNSIKYSWYTPMMYAIFMTIVFVLNLPIFMEIRPLTILLTFFIQVPLFLAIIMYVIAYQNYCALAAINC